MSLHHGNLSFHDLSWTVGQSLQQDQEDAGSGVGVGGQRDAPLVLHNAVGQDWDWRMVVQQALGDSWNAAGAGTGAIC
jgi:hypothetical protein